MRGKQESAGLTLGIIAALATASSAAVFAFRPTLSPTAWLVLAGPCANRSVLQFDRGVDSQPLVAAFFVVFPFAALGIDSCRGGMIT